MTLPQRQRPAETTRRGWHGSCTLCKVCIVHNHMHGARCAPAGCPVKLPAARRARRAAEPPDLEDTVSARADVPPALAAGERDGQGGEGRKTARNTHR